MKPHFVITLGVASVIFLACNNEKKETTTDTDTTVSNTDTSIRSTPDTTVSIPLASFAEAVLTGTKPDTTVTGSARFDTTKGKVKMVIEISVPLKAGKEVAVHIHEHGDCGNMGQMAHGHWNPGGTQHGKWGSGSFHAGDIGNIKLDSKGNGKMTLETDLWSLGGDASKNILGKAIIVHGGIDDYKTQPTGNAGSRIGCGVIR
jgi:superoxide dismutase, Cu-Zn family